VTLALGALCALRAAAGFFFRKRSMKKVLAQSACSCGRFSFEKLKKIVSAFCVQLWAFFFGKKA
jgi:hypothetical protein